MRKFTRAIITVALSVIAVFAVSNTAKADGWVTGPDGNYYYFYDNGTYATNTTIGFFTVGPSGKLSPKEAQDQTNAFLAQVQATQAQQAQAAKAQATQPAQAPVAQPKAQQAQAPAAQAPVAQTVTPVPVASGDLSTICSDIVSKTVNPSSEAVDQIRALYNYMMAATSYKRTYETPTGYWGPAYALE